MVDFSHVQQLEVTSERTVPFTLHQITINGKTPVLHVAPATDANKPYFNALLKRASKVGRAVKAGKMTAAMLEENREEDRDLYPRHVIKGWDDVLEAGGEYVPFGTDACHDFIAALPNWVFDDVRNFCGEASNFVEVMDVQVVAKNSQSGSASS